MFNVYCDESCHLEKDHEKAMVLGSIWCSKEKIRDVNESIKSIKRKYDLSETFEAKWTKVSPGQLKFYKELIQYFFNTNFLYFRGVIVPDKKKLDHSAYNQTHDGFYYKMYYNLLDVMKPNNQYSVYIDIKDTRSNDKVLYLQKVLRSQLYDRNGRILKKIQQIHSHEVQVMQLVDLLTGALAYFHRNLKTSPAKLSIIELIQENTNTPLRKTTYKSEKKMNYLIWESKSSNE